MVQQVILSNFVNQNISCCNVLSYTVEQRKGEMIGYHFLRLKLQGAECNLGSAKCLQFSLASVRVDEAQRIP